MWLLEGSAQAPPSGSSRYHQKKLKPQAPGYCDEELVVEDNDRLDDFHMAAISWLLLKEWDNPMWSEAARNSLLARLTVLPWWLDDQGMAIANFSIALSHPELLFHEILLLKGLLVVSLAFFSFWY